MSQSPLGTSKEIRKVLDYLRNGFLLKVTHSAGGVALLIAEGAKVPAGTARYAVAEFLKSSGVLETVEEGWNTKLYRLRPDLRSLDEGDNMRQEGYVATPRVDLDQLQLFVRRKEHSNPMLDSVASLLERLAQGASITEIEELIRRDVELTLRIVRAAGAPAFGGRKVQSVRHGIELLGFDQLHSIISTIALFSAGPKNNLGPGITKERFQRRSLLLALLSRTLATRLGLPNEECHFMAGLLQECGYLPIGRLVPEKLEQVVAVSNRTEVADVTELERYYLRFSHAEAGRAFGEEYHFCDPVLEAIAHHHQPMFAKSEYQVYADVGHVASWIANQLGLVAFEGCPAHELDHYTAKRLNIDPSDLHSNFGAVHQTAKDSYEVLSRR